MDTLSTKNMKRLHFPFVNAYNFIKIGDQRNIYWKFELSMLIIFLPFNILLLQTH